MNMPHRLLLTLTTLFSFSALATTMVTLQGERILRTSDRGKAIYEKLNAEEQKARGSIDKLKTRVDNLQQEIIAKKESLNKQVKEFEESAEMLSKEAQQAKFDELQEERRSLEQKAEEHERLNKQLHSEAKRIQERLNAIHDREMGSFQIEIKEIIQESAKEHGWDIVFMHETLVYSSAKVDKTQTIIDALNKQEEKRIKDRIEKDKKTLVKDQEKLTKLQKASKAA